MAKEPSDLLGLYQRLTMAGKSEDEVFSGLSAAERLGLIESGKMWVGTVHDLKNQFGIVAGHLTYLLEHGELNSGQKWSVKIVLDSLLRSRAILEATVCVMRGDPPCKETAAINQILERAVMEAVKYRDFFPDGIRIEKKFGEENPKVTVDALQMERVFFNLIRNAVEAMKESGTGNTLQITSWQQEDGVFVSIRDNGPGLPSFILTHPELCHPLSTTRRDKGGSGLGLMLAQHLVKAHGGNIWMRNLPEGGAEFLIVLPVSHEVHEPGSGGRGQSRT